LWERWSLEYAHGE